eukprot:c6611_g1_i2.p1 GENE.c6611_g1_i2~~c6611_g1_i2.p1  ORF type:complete len:438 (+),score=111.53 c6611_g1_i2:33-1316(+)
MLDEAGPETNVTRAISALNKQKQILTTCTRVGAIADCLNALACVYGNTFEAGGDLSALQRASIENGIVQVVISSSLSQGKARPMTQELALHCLKWIGLDNPSTSETMFADDLLIAAIARVIKEAVDVIQTGDRYRDGVILARNEAAIRFIATLSRSLPNHHSALIEMFGDSLGHIVANPKHPNSIRLQSVNWFAIVGCNTIVSHKISHCRTALISIASLNDTSLNSIVAMITVANISCAALDFEHSEGHLEPSKEVTQVMEDYIDVMVNPVIMKMLKEALSRTVEGRDYPTGSHRFLTLWMLCMGTANLSRSVNASRMMKQVGVVKTLLRISPQIDSKAHKFAAFAIAMIRMWCGNEKSLSLSAVPGQIGGLAKKLPTLRSKRLLSGFLPLNDPRTNQLIYSPQMDEQIDIYHSAHDDSSDFEQPLD